jgi:hypothetical protein
MSFPVTTFDDEDETAPAPKSKQLKVSFLSQRPELVKQSIFSFRGSGQKMGYEESKEANTESTLAFTKAFRESMADYSPPNPHLHNP